MSPLVPLAACASAGRLLPRLLGARYAWLPAEPAGRADAHLIAQPDDLTTGTRALRASSGHSAEAGPLAFSLTCARQGDAATIDWHVHNHSDAPIRLDAAVLGARWTDRPPGSVRFLRHGWQSWSFSGMRTLDPHGEPAFPGAAWIRGMHHAVGERPADRTGWHESAIVTVAGVGARGPACLGGALESGRGFAVVYLRHAPEPANADPDRAIDIDIEIRLEMILEPGAARALEPVRFALGDDDARLLERFATLWGRTAGARTGTPLQLGWCSWYHYFHRVTEADILRNLDQLAAVRTEIPTEVVQVDDGFQRAVGDWLETGPAFPRGLAPLAADIRAAGFRAGLWTAPFCAVPESRLVQEHPEWLLQHRERPFIALYHREWSARGLVHALDPTRPEVIAHLCALFAALVDMGWDYLKLDFLFVVATRCDAADPSLTRAERLRRGLQAIRAGAGERAYLLGCGCPLGPAVGVVDGMRVGPDVAPHWKVRALHAPGLGPVVPATENAVRGVVHRMWMHRRLWVNDPDCLLARSRDTDLTADELRTLSAVVAATGGPVVFSDDVTTLSADDRARVGEVAALARRIDDAWPCGAVRARGWGRADGTVEALVARTPRGAFAALLNAGEQPVVRALSHYLPGVDHDQPDIAAPCLGSDGLSGPGHSAGALSLGVPPHAAAVYWLPAACDVAVFCDFDGTFITSDVWVQVIHARATDLLPALWHRYLRGDMTIWETAEALAEGISLSESELAAMLADVALDRGARGLLGWCRARGVPFRIVSDGFDAMIERLLRGFGLSAPVIANRLRMDGDRLRVTAGAPDPACSCGCGVCKRAQVEAWRVEHPRALCVFIGNGRISDLCGAMAADWVFAKDSLAAALDERGVAYQRFADLTEVTDQLDRLASVAPV